jgi:drug/metabolite transporter (DMT)-like permease
MRNRDYRRGSPFDQRGTRAIVRITRAHLLLAAGMAVMPLSAVGLSYLLLDEQFAGSHAAGLVAVLAGIAAIAHSGARSQD